MKKMINSFNAQGRLYEHKLEVKETGPNSKNPGTTYISGSIDVATDDNATNIVTIHYTYVTEKTKKGNANPVFNTLMNIYDGSYGSIMSHGIERAVKLKIDSSIGLNDFYTDRNGEEELVSAKRNDGGFVRQINEFEDGPNNKFTCDMIITNVRIREADAERELPEQAIIKGAIFNSFRGDLLPVEFAAVNPEAIKYFISLAPSQENPIFTKVWGEEVSTTIVRKSVEESAFGEDFVREVKSSRKEFLINGALKIPYEWDSEETITAKELTECIANRELYLATKKKDAEEWRQRSAEAAKASADPTPKMDSFGFKF